MQNFGDSDFPGYDKVEDPVVPDAEAVEWWVIVAPQKVYVCPRATSEGVVLECS